ncbi:MAG: site-2 protease family protein [Candidatus Colwellbacteria bacterium CG10_big_fil_rev_8_21_14_0_10_42_22]|uniref:Site-2 protease family protein n=1 Tax=Candidatus Colwellbacteria bacterium CG10_big_fil_rev_8_21_14_0_10_42_22 TaxID=1974540 RepID=A0A2H0VHK9_9BACT|nr:MAG: site-2 protease family protein [Candidatus Colwellbacteria bacterium CG10_big_fil_rev_8_21_14_0_10_42_22]
MDNILEIIFQPKVFGIVVLIMSVVVHEVAHGMVALKLGDQTAKNAGRLTINPIPHLDPIGSIFLPLLLIITNSPFLIGWAKPVPYNPLNLHKDYKYGPLKVALAGPGTNMALAIIMGVIIRVFGAGLGTVFTIMLYQVVFINVLLAVFNLIPIPPLDGSKILTLFLPPKYSHMLQGVGVSGIFFVFLFLMLFSGLIFGLASIITTLIVGTSII